MKVFIAAIFALSATLGASAMSCEDCDNNYACGVCLMEVSRRNNVRNCPLNENEMRNLGRCGRQDARGLDYGEYCNADNYQCGTVWKFRGGDSRPCGYREIYKKVRCDDDDREPARRPKPAKKAGSCEEDCDNNYECGVCLMEMSRKNINQCPLNRNQLKRLKRNGPGCSRMEARNLDIGDYCEAENGECGTKEQFPGGNRRPCDNYEVYKRVSCKDQKPANRPKCKDYCDNDYKCQICLKENKNKQCPWKNNKLDRLPPCNRRRNPTKFRGKDYCEGRGQCGTVRRACYEVVDCRD